MNLLVAVFLMVFPRCPSVNPLNLSFFPLLLSVEDDE